MFRCHVCGNTSAKSDFVSEVFTIDGHRVLVEHVPAQVCERCGEALFLRETTERVCRPVRGEGRPSKTVPLDVLPWLNFVGFDRKTSRLRRKRAALAFLLFLIRLFHEPMHRLWKAATCYRTPNVKCAAPDLQSAGSGMSNLAVAHSFFRRLLLLCNTI